MELFTFFSSVKLIYLLPLLLFGCASPEMTLMNNTPYFVDVTAENQKICQNLPPGSAIKIPSDPWKDRIGVAVAAYDSKGRYIGANDWIFYSGQSQVWRMDRITKLNP